ncbi:Hsp20/alpha crystallin family protein [Nocardia tengchongensis]|uniref:Hsp20/alpha crystallin family protein n=1 Tax=Nocardia tengchongensis TaxID=2055889 RepID=A0ABX8CJ65_9NOCA|nr:Hsp20/alpha crystallin family protein [Nocardia tengchongensis]QVI20017.1 Hsp20/alpha crystallin family protein [Nocardia tengchongensis]
MSLIHRQPGAMLPDLAELWNSMVAPTVPAFATHPLRVEDAIDDKNYTVRAEIPGIDPAKDVQVSVHQGRLTIKAERTAEHEEKGRSEFSYGSFVRTVTLPPGAQEDGVHASYAKGILTVSVPLGEPQDPVRNIQVESAE